MRRTSVLMTKILAHEMRRIEKFSFDVVFNMPPYSDRKRGPFQIAYWRESRDGNAICLVVQVYYYGCLGMASVCADGMLFTPQSQRKLSWKEMTAYF